MSTEHEELAGYEYLAKFIEKGVVVLGKISSGIDMSGEDETYLRAINKVHFSGDFPIYKTKAAINDETAVQGGLFAEVSSAPTPRDYVHDDLAQ
jgi:hypothetical protein